MIKAPKNNITKWIKKFLKEVWSCKFFSKNKAIKIPKGYSYNFKILFFILALFFNIDI